MRLNSEGVKKRALELWDTRKVLFTSHARLRMVERRIRTSDIRMILLHGRLYDAREVKGIIRYRFVGWCEDGRDGHVVFEFRNGLLIITVIGEKENEVPGM